MMGAASFDVAICGGGLAGLTLARQLKAACVDLRIVLLEKSERPLPAACHKVGESSVELGAHYLGHVLRLKRYLEKNHLPKLGLRFFFGDSRSPLEQRPEWGASRFPPVPSYQLDRGILENDLRRIAGKSGITLWEGYGVEDIILGKEQHQVLYRKDGVSGRAQARWVIDSTGRRRLLQAKLGLKRANGHKASAVWFRMQGRIDVSDLVPSANKAWHERVPGCNRYYSTNHLMGRGYWVWLIPLSSGNTSIGIVADENIYPFRSYGSFQSAMAWLGEHEPRLAAFLRGRDPLDFKKMKDFSYSSAQIFSHERWACVRIKRPRRPSGIWDGPWIALRSWPRSWPCKPPERRAGPSFFPSRGGRGI